MITPNSKTLARPTAASQEVAVERNLTEIEQLDTLLTQRLGGDLNGYRDLLTDTTVTGAWAQRQTALTKLERQVLPHDPDNAADVEASGPSPRDLQGGSQPARASSPTPARIEDPERNIRRRIVTGPFSCS